MFKAYYAKCNKSDRERQIPYDFTYMWNLKSTNKQKSPTSQIQRTDWWLVVARGVGKMGEGSQKVQTSSYKISHVM